MMKKTMIRVIALLLAAFFCLQFAACASRKTGEPKESVRNGQDAPTSGNGSKNGPDDGPDDPSNVIPDPKLAAKLDEADLMRQIVAAEAPGKQPDGKFLAAEFDLAVKLFKAAAANDKDQNALISPLSILLALSMTANGAGGQTLSEMEAVLGCGMTIDELNNYLYTYIRSLPSGEKYKFHFADSIWFKDSPDFTVRQTFLQKNADVYGAQAYKHSFDPEVVKLINEWCRLHTDGMIDKILDEMSPGAVMVLLNALCFDAEWASVYTTRQIHDGVFTAVGGNEQTVMMMHSEEHTYLKDENACGFVKKYAGGKYSFAALLPDEGVDINDYIASLTGEKLQNVLNGRCEATVIAAIPKFSANYAIDLNDPLEALGMPTAFDGDKADFSGIGSSSNGNLYISSVLHKAFISVDERGTKAGAVTAVTVSDNAMPPQERYTVTLDRPFVYIIVDEQTDLPIFIGVQTSVNG